ncbi:MAG: tetratricopeptide repeat protein [Candidatus Aminicenantales bacterium]
MKARKAGKYLWILSLIFIFVYFVFGQEGRGKGRLQGAVLDEKGNPIENARIKVASLLYTEVSLETTPDKNGEWAVLGLGTGTWRVTVSADGYYPFYQDVDVKQLERNPEVNVTLKKLEFQQTFTIKDESSLSLFEEGNQLYAEKKYDEAISIYEQFIQKNPDIFQVHFNIGNCYKEKNELDKAMEEYKKILEEVKNREEISGVKEIAAKALAAMGECYLKQKDFENAQKYFKSSIELYPKDEALAYNVGQIYFSNNNIEEAIHYFELAKQINPNWGSPYLRLGYAYLNKGDYAKAKENLTQFLKIDPESPEAPTAKNIIEYLDKQKW